MLLTNLLFSNLINLPYLKLTIITLCIYLNTTITHIHLKNTITVDDSLKDVR